MDLFFSFTVDLAIILLKKNNRKTNKQKKTINKRKKQQECFISVGALWLYALFC